MGEKKAPGANSSLNSDWLEEKSLLSKKDT
jgi:hypothetical protein